MPTILVIENDDSWREVLIPMQLKDLGVDVALTRTLEGAREVLRDSSPDVIVLDLCLDHEQYNSTLVRDQLHQIHEAAPRTPIVVVTGKTVPGRDVFKGFRRFGVVDYFEKQTIRWGAFRKAIRKVLHPSKAIERAYIFISYSHNDERYKKEFEKQMAPLRKYHDVKSWSDKDIPVSCEWRREIENAMEHCKMAVALVTSSFLSSHFCMDVELREFVKARAERGLKLVAVLLSDCYWQAVPDLARYQLLPRNGTPIKSARNRELAWSKVVEEIGKILDIQLP